jgi:hypothetical protein
VSEREELLRPEGGNKVALRPRWSSPAIGGRSKEPGTRPGPLTVIGRSNPPEPADLIWTSVKSNHPYGIRYRNSLYNAFCKSASMEKLPAS